MNQILFVPGNIQSQKKISKKFIFFYIQLLISIVIAIFLMVYLFLYLFHINTEEQKSTELLQNYNLIKLYYKNIPEIKSNYPNSILFGTINIPKFNLCYPVFSELSEKNLKVSPCKFSGPLPQEYGNICIAGHNYDNNKFFGNIFKLNIGDQIILSDIYGNNFLYSVTSFYEVSNKNFSIIYPTEKNKKELTLLTCNNKNKKRFIVKCIQI